MTLERNRRDAPHTYLALSGSGRSGSTNTALLGSLTEIESSRYSVRLFEGHLDLPIFNPDREGERTPDSVAEFCANVDRADGLIISSPEYVRAIPGGLKNAIDWLVSREEIIAKPVALAHASHRGDDMLASLGLVLSTITSRFDEEHFLRFHLMKQSPERIRTTLSSAENRLKAREFLDGFHEFVQRG